MLGHSIVSQHFMEPEGSMPNSQQLSTCSYFIIIEIKFCYHKNLHTIIILISSGKNREVSVVTDDLYCSFCRLFNYDVECSTKLSDDGE
jgi:hypothetical protein